MSPVEDRRRLPVTIIAGFLGSGKTTLVNHILVNQQGLKVGVIVNEIGEIGIDSELIIATNDGMVELSNGCICCSVNNDLVDAVFTVLHRDSKVDYVIVESTGVADPLPIALTFLRSEFRDLVRLDSIVTLADAGNFSLDLFASKAAHNQLAYADTILLNKCDLASGDRLRLIEEKIRRVKKGVRILRTTQCRVPLPLILGVGEFQSDRCASADHTDCNHAHLAEDGFDALSFEADHPFAAEKFQHFLEWLPENVFRAKGLISVDESEKPYIFHLVGQRFTLDESDRVGPVKNRLVLIGRNLDRQQLLRRLRQCVVG
jgi:G3E family GTPase